MSKLSVAARFAHLLGLAAAPTASTEEPAPLAAVAAPIAAVAAPVEQQPLPLAAAKPKAEEEEKDEQMSDESDEDYEKRTGKKGKKAKAEKDKDDEDDKEMHGGDAIVQAARGRERARCEAILGHPHAAANLNLALTMAFDTGMSRNEARAALDKCQPSAFAAPAANTSRSQLAQRLAAEPAAPVVKPGAAAPAANTPEARAAACFAAADAARGVAK